MPDLYLPPLCTIHPWSPEALGPQLNAWGKAINTTSLTLLGPTAYYFPFKLFVPVRVRQLFVFNGAVVSGNIDIGLFTKDGVRIVSSGSTAQSGTSALQAVPIANIELGPGQFYCGLAVNNGTAAFSGDGSPGVVASVRFLGSCQSPNFPLPAQVSFTAPPTINRSPFFGLSTRSLI